jgi:hypothetical protein
MLVMSSWAAPTAGGPNSATIPEIAPAPKVSQMKGQTRFFLGSFFRDPEPSAARTAALRPITGPSNREIPSR